MNEGAAGPFAPGVAAMTDDATTPAAKRKETEHHGQVLRRVAFQHR
jgi:hypothetical protein